MIFISVVQVAVTVELCFVVALFMAWNLAYGLVSFRVRDTIRIG